MPSACAWWRTSRSGRSSPGRGFVDGDGPDGAGVRAPVRTFTVGFSDPAYDESASAAAVAAKLGTDHTEERLHPDEAMAAIPTLPVIYDEPFADSSQLPTLLVSRLARREITVALTGDGADELFAGYNRHAWCERLWGRLEAVPLRAPRPGAVLALPSPGAVDRMARVGSRGLPPSWRLRTPSTKVAKLARILPSFSPEDMYQRLTSHWPDPERPRRRPGADDTGLRHEPVAGAPDGDRTAHAPGPDDVPA